VAEAFIHLGFPDYFRVDAARQLTKASDD